MIFILVVLLTFLKNYDSEVVHIDRGVEIQECDGSISTTDITPDGELQCVSSLGKIRLGAKADVQINSVIYQTKADAVKSTLCKKIDGSLNYEVEVKDLGKVKALVYTVKEDVKAILFSADTTKCYEGLMATDKELQSEYLRVTSIKCMTTSAASDFFAKNTKEYKVKVSTACFLGPMIKNDVQLNVTIKDKLYALTISAVPKQECPKCPATENNSTKSTNTSDSSTHAASTSTTIIVVIVVVIVIVLLGGVGFVMMKK